MPPIPLVTATPSRSGSTSGAPASAQASRAATSANCSQRSIRRACTRPTTSTGSTAAAAAMRTGRSSAHGSVSRRDAAAPLKHRRPGRRDIPAERGSRAEPGDDDASSRPAVTPNSRRSWLTKFTTSWTVLRSFSWSSGISTPNLSCAATAISTIDSESMSRSSTKLLLGVTSSAGTPAISSTISPSPARISWSVMAVCSFSEVFVCLPPRGGLSHRLSGDGQPARQGAARVP